MHGYRFVALALVALFLGSVSGNADEKVNTIPDKFRTVLEKAETLELLSIDPIRPKEKSKDSFCGWNVLGRTTVKDAKTCKKLVAALKTGVEGYSGIATRCFEPRHAIRASYRGTTVDFLICFQCVQVAVYVEDKRVTSFGTSQFPKSVFDGVLTEAKVPLAEKPKEK